MGSKSDEYFLQRVKEGERQVFFTQNSPIAQGWSSRFVEVVKEFGLTPILYDNVAPEHGEKFQTIGDEMVEDFYTAKTVVLFFGPSKGKNYQNHWALSNLRELNTKERNIFVYVSEDYPRDVLRSAGWDDEPTVISSADEFVSALRGDLSKVAVR